MATSEAQGATMLADGEHRILVGTLIGYRERDPQTRGTRTYRNCDVGITVNGRIETISFGSLEAARQAVGPGAQQGDRVAVLFEQMSGSNEKGDWSFRRGIEQRDSSAFAEEFTA